MKVLMKLTTSCPLRSVRSKLVNSTSMHMLLFSLSMHFITALFVFVFVLIFVCLFVCFLLADCCTFGMNRDIIIIIIITMSGFMGWG